MRSNTDGNFNVAIGNDAGVFLNTGDGNTFLGAKAGENLTDGDYNVIVGYNACDSLLSASNNLCIGANGNNLITGNFAQGIVVLGNGLGYTHVDGDLYVYGTIYEGQTPTSSNSDSDSDNSSSNTGTAAASNAGPSGESTDSDDLGPIFEEPDPGAGASSDDPQRDNERFARLNEKLNSADQSYTTLNADIQANAQAISSLQSYVQEMHVDMNAGFAMSAAISAKAFPARKGWSFYSWCRLL